MDIGGDYSLSDLAGSTMVEFVFMKKKPSKKKATKKVPTRKVMASTVPAFTRITLSTFQISREFGSTASLSPNITLIASWIVHRPSTGRTSVLFAAVTNVFAVHPNSREI